MMRMSNDNNGDADELELDTSEAVEQQCWWQHGEREPRHQIDNEDDNWTRWLRSFAIVDKVVHEDKTNLMTGMTCPPLAPRLTTPSQDNIYCAPQTLFTWLGCSWPVSWLLQFQNYTGSKWKTTTQSKLPRSRELKFSLISIACDQVAACSVSRFSAAGFGFLSTQQPNKPTWPKRCRMSTMIVSLSDQWWYWQLFCTILQSNNDLATLRAGSLRKRRLFQPLPPITEWLWQKENYRPFLSNFLQKRCKTPSLRECS